MNETHWKSGSNYCEEQIKFYEEALAGDNPIKGDPLNMTASHWALILKFVHGKQEILKGTGIESQFISAMIHDLADRATREEILALMTHCVTPSRNTSGIALQILLRMA